MKASLWAVILSVLLGASAKAQQPTTPLATGALATNRPSKLDEIRAKAEHGDPAAQFSVGCQYETGSGVPQDSAEAVKWFCKAAEQSLPVAQFSLGFCYEYGKGVTQNSAEAVNWYRKAADQRFATAQYGLGFCYERGKGVTQNSAEAVKWYRKAAQQGNAIAQFNLGVCYYHGNGVTQDHAEAASWYRKAAEQGEANAENNLGACYASGNGVIKDYVQAYKWDNLASAQGIDSAKQFLPNLERRMAPEQIAEAQRLAREFKPSKAAELAQSLPGASDAVPAPASSGTGFFITEDGFLVSAAHVVNGATQIRLVARTEILQHAW